MNEKMIRIFLASSDELKLDRLEFGDFVGGLNNIYRKRGIFLELLKWENFDAAYSLARKQEEYNEIVAQSDVFLALFHTKAGQYTVEEFDYARECFANRGSPKIYTQFKKIAASEQEDESLASFRKRLETELTHYYGRYENTDTLKLTFILQIKVLELDNPPKVELSDSKLSVDGKQILDIGQVSFIAKNENYTKLKEQLQATLQLYDKALSRSLKYPDDEDFHADAVRFSQEKDRISQEMRSLEEDSLRLAEDVVKLGAKGVLSTRMKQAVSHLEMGNIAGAKALLDFDAISTDLQNTEHLLDKRLAVKNALEEQIQTDMEQILIYIDELLLRIDALCVDLQNINRFSEMEAAYLQAVKYEEKYNLYPKATYRYAEYLSGQDKLQNALDIYLGLLTLEVQQHGAQSAEVAVCSTCIGTVYGKMSLYQKAKDYCQTSIEILNALPDSRASQMITSLNEIANALVAQGDYSKALSYNEQALTLCKTHYGENNLQTAETYIEIAWVYEYLNQSEKTILYLHKSEKILIRHYGVLHPSLVPCYNALAWAYDSAGEYEKIAAYADNAFDICSKIYSAYHSEIGMCYKLQALSKYRMGRYEECLELNKKALTVFRVVYGKTHARIAIQHFQIGICLTKLRDYRAACVSLATSVAMEQEVAGGEPVGDIAINYNYWGKVLCLLGRHEEGFEKLYKGLLMAMKEYGEASIDVSESYLFMGEEHYRQNRFAEALDCLKRSIACVLTIYHAAHPEMAIRRFFLGEVQIAFGDAYEGRMQIEKATAIFNSTNTLHLLHELERGR